jgi:pilus assembly protein TadC
MAAATAALAGSIAVLGATHGAVVGTGLAVATLVVRHRDARSGADPVAVPLVVDLIAGCLSAGVPMPDALDAVTAVDPGELSARCRATAAALRAGAPADEAWADWLADPWLAPVARTTLRSSLTGAATAADLRRTATRLRSRRRAAELARVRRASVWVVVPLGLCFLPAFVLVAVVPLVAGLLPTFR